MSGPALRQLEAHRSIHQAANGEAEELLSIVQRLHHDGIRDRALETAHVLIEHWETRTLRHAESEEEGFYLEKGKKNPHLLETITKLTRDHDLMRLLVNESKDILQKDGVNKEVIVRFEALLLLVEIHSREEEKYLLSN
ncbi:hypothetical protein [Aneurinibacillus terranovensis]|uniref:hypothetical protein n=1 Tax=Aneurinibacillus terranovensis TaxID=278991 RepID=UPI0004286BA1|nr:hypothetical protein [Aneurinibacillus terranovensis]